MQSVCEMLTEAWKIWLLSQKVQIPRITHVKNSLQVSYYLDQYKAVTFYYISNIMAAEAANLP